MPPPPTAALERAALPQQQGAFLIQTLNGSSCQHARVQQLQEERQAKRRARKPTFYVRKVRSSSTGAFELLSCRASNGRCHLVAPRRRRRRWRRSWRCCTRSWRSSAVVAGADQARRRVCSRSCSTRCGGSRRRTMCYVAPCAGSSSHSREFSRRSTGSRCVNAVTLCQADVYTVESCRSSAVCWRLLIDALSHTSCHLLVHWIASFSVRVVHPTRFGLQRASRGDAGAERREDPRRAPLRG